MSGGSDYGGQGAGAPASMRPRDSRRLLCEAPSRVLEHVQLCLLQAESLKSPQVVYHGAGFHSRIRLPRCGESNPALNLPGDIHLRSPTSAHLLEGLAQPPGEAFRLPYEKPAGGLHSVRLGFARGIVSRERHRKNHRKCELVHRRPELAVLTCSHSLHPVIH
jgi:hypothetical protein